MFQRDILRLITRGFERNRRAGSSRSVISRRLWAVDRASREGGKRRLPGHAAADDAKGAGEGDPVGIVPGLESGLVHQVAQRMLDQQECEDLLFDAAWVPGTQHHPRDALVVLDLVQGVLDLPPLGIGGRQAPRPVPGRGRGGW